jgi:hypothetical protein
LAGFGVFIAATNSGSDEEVAFRKFAHLAGVFISEKVTKPKWSAPLGGLKLQVPEPVASSANAFHVSPADSILSMIFGAVIPQQQ